MNDGEGDNLNATDLSTLGGKTGGTVTVSNAVNIQGNTAQVTAALVTDETKVVASNATVEISNASTVAELNALAPKAGVITGSIAATSLASLSDLATAGTDLITITVNDGEGDNFCLLYTSPSPRDAS